MIGRLRRMKSMQPKSFEEDLKNSAERLKKKRKRLETADKRRSLLAPESFSRGLSQETLPMSPLALVQATPFTPQVPDTPTTALREAQKNKYKNLFLDSDTEENEKDEVLKKLDFDDDICPPTGTRALDIMRKIRKAYLDSPDDVFSITPEITSKQTFLSLDKPSTSSEPAREIEKQAEAMTKSKTRKKSAAKNLSKNTVKFAPSNGNESSSKSRICETNIDANEPTNKTVKDIRTENNLNNKEAQELTDGKRSKSLTSVSNVSSPKTRENLQSTKPIQPRAHSTSDSRKNTQIQESNNDKRTKKVSESPTTVINLSKSIKGGEFSESYNKQIESEARSLRDNLHDLYTNKKTKSSEESSGSETASIDKESGQSDSSTTHKKKRKLLSKGFVRPVSILIEPQKHPAAQSKGAEKKATEKLSKSKKSSLTEKEKVEKVSTNERNCSVNNPAEKNDLKTVEKCVSKSLDSRCTEENKNCTDIVNNERCNSEGGMLTAKKKKQQTEDSTESESGTDSNDKSSSSNASTKQSVKSKKVKRKESSEESTDSGGNPGNVSRKRNKTEKSVATKRKIKPKRSIVMTSLHCNEQGIVLSVVKKLGGFYVLDKVGSSTSHVVAGGGRRTLNVLLAISQGAWLVSPEWVMKSLEVGHWVDEEPYELSDDFPVAQLCRLERVSSGRPNYQQDLLSEAGTIFISDNTSPPPEDILTLVMNSGGKVSTSVRKADICIGPINRRVEGVNVVEKWLIDCVSSHSVLPLKTYIIENGDKNTERKGIPIY